MTIGVEPHRDAAPPDWRQRGQFASLADARAFVAAAEPTVAGLAACDIPGFFRRLASTYDEFPELEAEVPPRALLERWRGRAETLAEKTALPQLLLCAAWDPAAAAAPLLARAAAAGGLPALLPVLQLLHDYRAFGWEEIAAAADALHRRGSPRDAAAAVAAVLDRLTPGGSQNGGGSGDALMLSLVAADTAIDPPVLAAAAASARRRLAPAAAPSSAAAGMAMLAIAERLRRVLSAPGRPAVRSEVAWPSGRFAFVEFASQWPQLEMTIPATLLRTAYASVGDDGALTAEQHRTPDPLPFCYGPYLNLPAGKYHLRITGRTGRDVAFVVLVTRSLGTKQLTVCERKLANQQPMSGVIAEVPFESREPLYGFEVILYVAKPSVHFSIADMRLAVRPL